MLIFNKAVLMLLAVFYSIIALFHSCDAASNLALGKPYAVSPNPNYSLTASPTDVLSLTDGKYSAGFFWTQKTTVGWANVKNVEILIDLQKLSTISSIIFSTVRGKDADVYYPAHIHAFAGPDKEHLLYVGDVAVDAGNLPGLYQTKRFSLDGIGIKGRYVLLEVEPKGYYLFCDEVEVLEGGKEKNKSGSLTIEKARNFSRQANWLEIEKKLLDSMEAKLKLQINASPESANRLANIRQRIESKDVESIETDILTLRGALLRSQFKDKQLLVEAVNPWAPLSPVSSPSGVPVNGLSFTVPQGGYDHAALLITNLSPHPQRIDLVLEQIPAEAPGFSVYEVPFVKSRAMESVADPLVPVKDGFTLLSGESRMVFVTAQGNRPGTWQSQLKISSGDTVTSIQLKRHVSKVMLPNNFTLNTVNWGYFDTQLIENHKKEAIKDLIAHHINVIVVPPGQIPLAERLKPVDFAPLEAYLKLHRNASKVLLYMAYNWDEKRLTCNGTCKFMEDEWKAGFQKWYAGVINAAARAGVSPGQLYLYPFDEMHGKDVGQFIALALWARKEIPGIQFYATLDSMDSLKAIPYLDIAQIANIDDRLNSAGLSKAELWLYDTKGSAKSLSPYTYYRLMPWKAFLLGFKGAGLWDYSSFNDWGGASGVGWDDFAEKSDPHSVIYEGSGGTIVSSRRWDGWRMGVEDYELLTMYAKTKGIEAARALTRSVLDHPEEISKADEIRQMILRELSN